MLRDAVPHTEAEVGHEDEPDHQAGQPERRKEASACGPGRRGGASEIGTAGVHVVCRTPSPALKDEVESRALSPRPLRPDPAAVAVARDPTPGRGRSGPRGKPLSFSMRGAAAK